MVVSNLARSLAAHDYTVLIVDCDLRRPTQHRIFEQENETTGLLPWLAKRRSVPEDFDPLREPDLGIREIVQGHLYLIPAGGATRVPSESLDNRAIGPLLKNLKGRLM